MMPSAATIKMALFALPSCLALLCCLPARAQFEALSAEADYGGIPVPLFRYVLWNTISPSTTNHETLGYEHVTWNIPGTNEIENLSYESIGIQHGQSYVNALGEIGFSDAQWDCYVNHYDDYNWYELAELGIQQHYETLGWDAAMWQSTAWGDIPESEDLYWNELSKEEQAAALALCYVEPIWDGLGLEFWQSLPELPTPAPTRTPAPTAWSTPKPSFPPTPQPSATYRPTQAPSSPRPTLATLPQTSLPDYPGSRFVAWDALDKEIQTVAQTVLKYSAETWNEPGTASVESMAFQSLEWLPNGYELVKAATNMGWAEHSWDCHMNHYTDYPWNNLTEVPADAYGYATRNVRVYYKALGWTWQSWNGILNPPVTDTLDWDELTERQRQAAAALCYTAISWDSLDLSALNGLSHDTGIGGVTSNIVTGSLKAQYAQSASMEGKESSSAPSSKVLLPWIASIATVVLTAVPQ